MKVIFKIAVLGWIAHAVTALGVGFAPRPRLAEELPEPMRFQVSVATVQTPQEQAILQILLEESERRGRVDWAVRPGTVISKDSKEGMIVLAQRGQVEGLLPNELVGTWHTCLAQLHPTDTAEGFSIVTLPWHGRAIHVIAGNDVRGELFGVGWLLRHMSFAGGSVQLPTTIKIFSAPDKQIRGHQIGYRMKNNTYDAWNLTQFEQQIRDLAIFGANTVQLIAPISDDEPVSPLMPAPPLETFLGISQLLAKYGLDCDLYYPEMRKNYSDPAQTEAELKDFEALIKAMPRADALYVPGGDPGHTTPEILFPLLEKEAAIIRKYHPGATVWVSAQGFDAAEYEQFYALLAKRPEWLTGVFFGPQSRDSMETQRRRIPRQYALQFYPDIGHTMHAQFPVPQWDPVFALTEGREPICPRPLGFAHIYQHFEGLHSGFITYSEGVNDDVNKILWTELGWSSQTPAKTILGEYARWFLHREGMQEAQAVQAILGLEANWQGPLQTNREIPRTSALLEDLERHSTLEQIRGNWRWESLLYRGYYDAYVQRKFAREQQVQDAALAALRGEGTSRALVGEAKRTLSVSIVSTEEQRLHDRLFGLAGDLFRDGGLQLSVKLYGASNWERGANLDRVDTPLNDRVWMQQTMDKALTEPTESERLQALKTIVDWQHPVPGAIYDDLGSSAAEPHLVGGLGWSQDPEMYATAIDGIADRTLADGWRLSWLSYAEALYEQPLEMQYTDLNSTLQYRLRVTYAGEDYAVPLTLTAANGVEIHPARLRRSNPEVVEFAVPHGAIMDGTLRLRWTRPAGIGGGGRGRQIAEVWLIPQPPSKH
ncbi:hypothetical protein [Granulicella arctica]|uniref:Beta-hexosaminidase bacterial type N-terminal domain-containing protein n=1 Tax=Granulicella arctica TaxID=940613 RepID=A0A7Y9TH12_9BACT|nr:hypothetical protein [Granulicella arctica]NYF80064.1 hypothetical protein [Granulicella arctica]